jgi:CheY-like chemotaxis protein
VVHSFESLINTSRVNLRLDVAETVPSHLTADSARLQQILFNLLGNSVKFTTSGSIHLHVDSTPAGRNHVALNFILEDTGVGIPEKMREQLFEPFVQADGSFQRKYKGTGLGLSIVRQLITLMGGNVGISSREGFGTRVEFSIIAATDIPGTTRTSFAEPTQDNHIRRANILVVEDENINAMVIMAMLQNQGHCATLATSGREAVELVRNTPFDCILMDIQMPEMDGVEAAGLIRKNNQRNGTVTPIVAVTAHAMKGDRENFLGAGMDDYLTKPVDATVLAETLQRILARKT